MITSVYIMDSRVTRGTPGINREGTRTTLRSQSSSQLRTLLESRMRYIYLKTLSNWYIENISILTCPFLDTVIDNLVRIWAYFRLHVPRPPLLNFGLSGSSRENIWRKLEDIADSLEGLSLRRDDSRGELLWKKWQTAKVPLESRQNQYQQFL